MHTVLKVLVTELPDAFRVTADSRVTLDRSRLCNSCRPARLQAIPGAKSSPGAVQRYEFEVPKDSWPWGGHMLREIAQDRFLGVASRAFVWGVDGTRFPNRSSEVVWALMVRGTPSSKCELSRIRTEWATNIHSDSELLARRVIPWSRDPEFDRRLEDRIARRALLVGWIDTFTTDGLPAARRYATKHRLIRGEAPDPPRPHPRG